MTIYTIKYLTAHTGRVRQEAFSSYTGAKKRLNELRMVPDIVIFDKDGEEVAKHQPKTQTDVINMINTL